VERVVARPGRRPPLSIMTATNGVAAEFARRTGPGSELAEDAAEIAHACHDMSLRFHRSGKLIVFGNGGTSTDSQHISVEFVHPVLVGKRALPALSLTNDVATLTGVTRDRGFAEVFAHQLRQLAGPDDIALGVSSDGTCENVLKGLETARQLGLLTIALTGGTGGEIASSAAVDHAFVVRSDDPLVVKEVHVTAYHILWELVHVFFEHPGLLDAAAAT
jgi:D-sedoheptulose 7-phosphate isomerase